MSDLRLADFDYELPPGRIAQRPPARRDDARLLVHDVAADATEHRSIRDLPGALRPGDLLVVNDTRVRPARVFGRRRSGGVVEFLLLGPAPETEGDGLRWRALVNPGRKLKRGEVVPIETGLLGLRALERPAGEDGRPGPEWLVAWTGLEEAGLTAEQALERIGRMPLPPYIERPRDPAGRGTGADELGDLDRERYQTVFAAETGAVAAPTAGLHLTDALLDAVRARGCDVARVTLHVGEGTFRPVATERVAEHRMHPERFRLPRETTEAIAACRARGGRVVAVGTTVVRTLESRARDDGTVEPGEGETSLYLLPGARFRVVDALLTNFHLPRSTLLMLVAAFAGRERVLRLYAEAIERGYRFLSYGDAMLLIGAPRR